MHRRGIGSGLALATILALPGLSTCHRARGPEISIPVTTESDILAAPRFTIPRPAGFVLATDPEGEYAEHVERARASDGLALVLDMRPEAEEESAVILAFAGGPPTEKVLSTDYCDALGAGMSAGLEATNVSAELLILPAGPGCLSRTTLDGATLEMSILYRGLESLGVMCTWMEDNPRAAEACRAVREGLVYTAEERARGRDFSVPIPLGYQLMPPGLLPRELATGRTALMSLRAPAYPDPFPASIVLERVPGSSFTFPDPEGCALIARATAKKFGGWVIEDLGLPVEGGCSVAIESPEPHRRSYWVLLDRQGGNYSVMCNVDYRDARAKEACEEVTAGFRVEALGRDDGHQQTDGSVTCERGPR